jgi:hypothetical protein
MCLMCLSPRPSRCRRGGRPADEPGIPGIARIRECAPARIRTPVRIHGSAGPAGSGGPNTRVALIVATACTDAEIEGCRDAGEAGNGESRDQNHGLHPEVPGPVGALARHTRPMTRAFPRCRERHKFPLDHRLLLTSGERVTRLKKFDLGLITPCVTLITDVRLRQFARVRLWRLRSRTTPTARGRRWAGQGRGLAHKW